jgi:putative ABC transport system permease protein
MRILDYLIIGFKNIWRRKSRSFLTILAVVIGAISMTIMLSLVIGAERVATQQIETIGGLTLISVSPNPDAEANGNLLSTDQGNSDSAGRLNDSSISSIKQIPHVVDATPIAGIWLKNMKLAGQEKRFYANVVAYEPGNKVLEIPVSAGRSLVAGDMDKIVIGQRALKSFGFTNNPQAIIGQQVILYAEGEYNDWEPDPPLPPENKDKGFEDTMKQPREIRAEIVGVITTGPDESQNYITMDWGRRLMTSKRWEWDEARRKEFDEKRQQVEQRLQKEMEQAKQNGQSPDELRKQWDERIANEMRASGYNSSNFQTIVRTDNILRNGYGSILVKADSTDNVDTVAKAIEELGFGTQTAKQMLAEIKKIFRMVGMLIGAIAGISLFVAAIGIINTMIMATYERTREIGILRACGATRATIRRMFLFEAAMLGFWGGVFGLAVSFGLAHVGNSIGNQIALSNGVPITNIISFPPWLIIGVIGLTTLIGMLAGLFPAIRAARLDPVEALRYE